MSDNQRLEFESQKEAGRSEGDAEQQRATVGTPANLIMAGCELDSLTDGPEVGLQGASASSEGREGWGRRTEGARLKIRRGGRGDACQQQLVTIQINSVQSLHRCNVYVGIRLRFQIIFQIIRFYFLNLYHSEPLLFFPRVFSLWNIKDWIQRKQWAVHPPPCFSPSPSDG